MSGSNGSSVRVGIVGLGRSGWNIHAATLRGMPGQYRVTAVTDPDADRRAQAEAELGCRAHADFESLLGDGSVELVVIASPNHLHAEHAKAAMSAGRDVVVEKPMALSAEEAFGMLEAAEQSGRVLAPFHNRRYEPHFQKVREVIGSGRLGRVVQVRMAWHNFTRRWDWQTLKAFGGGALNNNGSHLLDHALQLFGDGEPEVFVDLQRALASGDAEDHLKVVLRGPGKPVIDVELTSAAAYPQDRWHVMGTAGGLVGTPEHLEWKWVDWSAMPKRPVEREAAAGRAYNREALEWQTASWDKPADAPAENTVFYRRLHRSLSGGEPLDITPQSVARLIELMERCRALCPV